MRAPGALHAMTHPFGFQLCKKYVCVSTVAPSPAHVRALKPLPARLAWSVHAADDKLRKLLVPTTRHTMAELRDAWGERRPARTRLQPRAAEAATPSHRALQPHGPTLQPRVAGEVLAARRDRGLMAEVTLIDGVNDGAEHAEQLHALLAPLPGTSRTSLTPHCNPIHPAATATPGTQVRRASTSYRTTQTPGWAPRGASSCRRRPRQSRPSTRGSSISA